MVVQALDEEEIIMPHKTRIFSSSLQYESEQQANKSPRRDYNVQPVIQKQCWSQHGGAGGQELDWIWQRNNMTPGDKGASSIE